MSQFAPASKIFNNRFSNQVSIITGGSRGIGFTYPISTFTNSKKKTGFGISSRLGKEGSKVAIVDLEREQLIKSEKVILNHNNYNNVLFIEADVTNFSQVQTSVKVRGYFAIILISSSL